MGEGRGFAFSISWVDLARRSGMLYTKHLSTPLWSTLMNKPNNAELFRRLVETVEKNTIIEERVARLEAVIHAKIERNRPILHRAVRDRPLHSGHKGGQFMTEARTEFANRFNDSSLDWRQVNKWITQLFKIGSSASESATREDMIWLFDMLCTSLENGFAQAMKNMDG